MFTKHHPLLTEQYFPSMLLLALLLRRPSASPGCFIVIVARSPHTSYSSPYYLFGQELSLCSRITRAAGTWHSAYRAGPSVPWPSINF
jgi:hypothetical protein